MACEYRNLPVDERLEYCTKCKNKCVWYNGDSRNFTTDFNMTENADEVCQEDVDQIEME
nr:MAG TPA: lef-2-like protein [Caudoviricetes sp.]